VYYQLKYEAANWNSGATQGIRYFLIGFALALFFQTGCHAIIRPTIGRYYGEFSDFFTYLYTYSLPVWRACAFFGPLKEAPASLKAGRVSPAKSETKANNNICFFFALLLTSSSAFSTGA